jgi:hypothetical protein
MGVGLLSERLLLVRQSQLTPSRFLHNQRYVTAQAELIPRKNGFTERQFPSDFFLYLYGMTTLPKMYWTVFRFSTMLSVQAIPFGFEFALWDRKSIWGFGEISAGHGGKRSS